MTVYGINGTKKNRDVEPFLNQLAKETGAAILLSKDLTKYGCRIFHLFEAEVMNNFDIPLKETTSIVTKYFKSEGLPLDIHKRTFISNIFDYPIKEE